mgnify:FL=1
MCSSDLLVYGGTFTGRNFTVQQRNLTISGSVIEDANADGDATGDGVLTAPATVRLFEDTNASGSYEVATDVELTAAGSPATTSAGLWSFSALTPGTYFVTETDPATYASTNATPAGNKVSNGLLKVVLTAADSTGNAFLDALATSTISGTVWSDWDGSGTTAGALGTEPGRAGVVVYLDLNNNGSFTAGEPTATSTADGTFTITDLTAGTYRLRSTPGTGWANTGTQPVLVTLATGASASSGNDLFTRQTNLSIAGIVYQDTNADGIVQSGTILAGATLNLYADANADGVADGAALHAPITTVNSGGTPGTFTFSNLTPGRYLVQETNPSASYLSTNAIVGTGGTIAKVDADTLSFLLTSASSTGNQYLDGPMLATVTGTVSSDLNGNGTADAGEARGAGITVTLTRTGSGTYAGYTAVRTTTTNASGVYSFGSVLGGNYTIETATEVGYEKLSQPATITDLSGATGSTTRGLLTRINSLTISGSVIDDADASGTVTGAETTTSASPSVSLFIDTNLNGTYNAGTDQQIGSAGGATFSWSNLSSGTYFLLETDAANFLSTGIAAGSGGTVTKVDDNTIKVVVTSADSTNNRFLDSWSYTVTGTVYVDMNGNGSLDVGTDVGDPGITVTLSGSTSTTSGANGAFSFTGVRAGTRTLAYTLPTGWVNTGTAPYAASYSITLSGNAHPSARVFLTKAENLQITGFVYDDQNADGVNQTSTLLGGSVVTLYRDNDDFGARGQFDENDTYVSQKTVPTGGGTKGEWAFTALTPGVYFAFETDPSDRKSTRLNSSH